VEKLKGGVKLDLSLIFSSEKAQEPIISRIILKSQVAINILNVKLDESGGTALVSVPDERAEELKSLIEAEGISVNPRRTIHIDENLCIACGACISLCGVKALTYGPCFTIEFNENKCIYCSLCIDACPRFAIKTSEI